MWCEYPHVTNSLFIQDGEDLFFAREALQGKLPKYVELLKFKVSLWLCTKPFFVMMSRAVATVCKASSSISFGIIPLPWNSLALMRQC